jgi:hydrogenase expression/formation protein HypD
MTEAVRSWSARFREPRAAKELLAEIRARARRRWVLMDVCGGQTHNLLRYGIEQTLGETLELIHGPGCPVCVTSAETIDLAQRIALREDVILASFGDMLRVPGSRESLLSTRARGGEVRVVYSPLDAVQLAAAHPHKQVVLLAVGFETTAPATALAVLQAERAGLRNFSLLVEHVRVLPAMRHIAAAPHQRVDAFLAAGHVCTITGFTDYHPFAATYGVPVVITGFEPIDLLLGIRRAVELLETGQPRTVNDYARSVSEAGNPTAQQLIRRVYEVADQCWRGLGPIPAGGLALRAEYGRFCARLRFGETELPVRLESNSCRSAEVLTGQIKPTTCEHFGTRCTPETPLGAPMVSSEGACAAYFRYARSLESTPVEVDRNG